MKGREKKIKKKKKKELLIIARVKSRLLLGVLVKWNGDSIIEGR